MALTNYGDLKLAISTWLDRSDAAVTTNAEDFITLCNARIRQDIETADQESVTTISVSTQYVNLPLDILHIRMIEIDGDPGQYVDYVTPAEFSMLDYGGTGKPKRYTIINSQAKFYPPPDKTYTANIEYKAAYNLASATPTNYLMTNYPGVYLYSALMEANIFLMDDTESVKYKTLYEEQVIRINYSEKQIKYPTPLRMRSRITP